MTAITKLAPGKVHPKTFANHASPDRNRVPLDKRGGKRVPSRQSIDNQIPQLREAIRLNLIRAGTLALNGRPDAAMRRAEYAMHQKERLQALVSQYMENQAQPAKVDATHNPRKAATKTQVKRRTYKRWGDK